MTATSHRTGRRAAYTLIEMVLATVIMTIAAGLAVPMISSMLAQHRLDSGVDAVRAAWAMGRSKAISEGRPYRFAVMMGKGSYRSAPDSSDYWNGGSGSSSSSAGAGWVKEGQLPEGVTFAGDGSGGSGGWADVVVFEPDGTARDEVEISFEAKGAQGKVVHLRALTGAVTVKPLGRD
jgi:Tfp pilus assembly protein FimT